MKRNRMKLGALFCSITMILQLLIIPAKAYDIGELVSDPPSNWTLIADSSVDDNVAGGWKRLSSTTVTKNGSEYTLSGTANTNSLDFASVAADGYSDTLVFTTKYQLVEADAYFAIEGKHKSMIADISHDTTTAPVFINVSRTAITQSNVLETKETTINETITDTGAEHTLTAVFYIQNNSVQLWRDGEYFGAFPFRTPYGEALDKLRLRGRAGTVKFKDAKVYSVSNNPISVGDSLINEKFASPSTPQGWKLSGSTSIEAGSAQDDYLLKLQENSSADCQADFTLSEELTEGIFNVSYDVCVSSMASSAQFYLTGGAGHRVTSNIKKGGVSLTVGHSSTTQQIIPENTLSVDTWYTLKYIVNLTEKTHMLEVYKKEDMSPIGNSSWEELRNFASIPSLTKGFFRIAKGNGGVEYKIDNFRFEKDITNYGYLHIIPKVNSGLTVNGAENTIDGATDLTAGELKNLLYCHTPCTIKVTDLMGNEFGDPATVAGGYVVVENKYDSRAYTIKTEGSMSLLGLEVAGREWAENDSILLPGTANVRVLATNNSDLAKSFELRATADGETPVISQEIEIAAGATEIIKLENVVIPDNTPVGNLKLDLVENETVQYSFNKEIATGTEVSIPSVFADGMVLQRGEKTNIFGMAPTGAQIEVTFDGQTKTGVAANGEFCVQLENLIASNTGKTLTVEITAGGDTHTFTYNNVVVGDVFYGGGQSNMSYNFDDHTKQEGYATYQKATLEAVKADFETRENWENLRCFVLPNRDSMDDYAAANWTIGSRDNYSKMPSTMYAFVDSLRSLGVIDMDVPIGIVRCSIGGTSIGSWVDADILDTYKDRATDIYDKYLSGTPLSSSNEYHATDLYYAMANYVLPYTVKAAVWYHGEHDAIQPADAWYDEIATDMIELMRSKWGYDVPYFVVQLPGHCNADYTNMRLVQWQIRDEANDVYVVVSNDTGEAEGPNAVHPVDKRVIGDRLAREYAYHIAGDTTMPHHGPIYKSSWIDDGKVYVLFDNVNDGLHGGFYSQAQDGSYPGFSLSEDGTTWTTADVTVDGNALVLSATGLENPAYVSFAFDGLGRLGTANFPLLSAATKAIYDVNGTSKTSMLAVAPFKEAIGSEAGVITHTISFANGAADATGTVPESMYKKAGETITLPDNPFARTGYVFGGWNDGTADYSVGDTYTMPNENVVFTAVWSETNSITFDGNGATSGEAPIMSGATAGEIITLPQNTFVKPGFNFKCWNDGTADYMAGASYTMPAGNVTFTAVWEENQNVSDGTYVDESTSTLYVDLSDKAVEYPIRTMLAFYTNNPGDTAPTDPSDVVIFVQSLTEIESSYNFNSIAEPKDYMVVIYEGRAGQQLREVIELTHVTHWYNGWNKDEAGHWNECANGTCDYSISYEPHSDFVGGTTDCTANVECGLCGYISATSAYQEHLYTDVLDADCNREGCLQTRSASAVNITFNVNGGSDISPSTVKTGANGKISNNLPTPTRNGWSFEGWYTSATGGTKIVKNSTVFYENATVYAQWKSVYQTEGGSSGGGTVAPVTYKLHFETNGGTAINDLSRRKGVEVNVNGFVTTKEGYKFVGWYTDAELKNAVSSMVLTGNITVYAKWESVTGDPSTEPGSIVKNFTDVSKDDWFNSSVAFVLEKGIMNGISETEFGPHNTTTRAMLVTMLYRLDGEPETLAQNEFSDVSKDSYYEKAVIWAKENGIVNGYENGSFGPNDEVTREQLASILYRYAEHKGYNVNYEDTNILSFNDALEISEYAYPALQWVCKNGIVSGDDNNLMPKASAERCQVAAIFARFCELNKE